MMKRTFITITVLCVAALVWTIGPSADATPTPLDTEIPGGPITADITWDLAGSPYTILDSVTVTNSATLTIEPGVVVQFNSFGDALIIDGGATLDAIGTAAAPIHFTGLGSGPSRWDSLVINPSGSATLAHCEISQGGWPNGGGEGSLHVLSSNVAVTDCVIRDGGDEGIVIEGDGLTPSFTNVTIRDHLGGFIVPGYAIRQSTINMQPAYSNLTIEGNEFDLIASTGGTVTFNPLTVVDVGVPYLVMGSVIVGSNATLVLEPGVEWRFNNFGDRLDVLDGGTLTAVGTSDNRVVFTHGAEVTRSWDGILAAPGSTMALAYCDIGYGGWNSGGVDGHVQIQSSDVTIEHCVIHDSNDEGIVINGAGLTPIVRDVTISDANFEAIKQDTINMRPAYENLVATGTGEHLIVTSGGPLTLESLTILNAGLPYEVTDSVTVPAGATLTLEPGVWWQFNSFGDQLIVADGGTLTAVGTEAQPIVFTGRAGVPRSWQNVKFDPGSTGALRHCEVSNGGWWGTANDQEIDGNLYILSSDVTVQDCLIHRSDRIGIRVENAQPTLLNNAIQDNPFGVVNKTPGTVVDATFNYWGDPSGPFHPTLNPAGLGNEVSDGVLFIPWNEAPTQDEADLVVASIAADPAAMPGQPFAVSYTVNSSGSALNGGWTDSIYLSADNQFDPDDTLVTRITQSGGVAPNGSYTESATVPLPPALPGAYTVIVIADSQRIIDDPDLGNNTGASADPVVVDVPELPLGGSVDGSMADGDVRLYRVAAQAGGSFAVSSAFNGEIYVSHAAVPSPAHFDIRSQTAGGEQVALIANAFGGDYYVFLRSFDSAPTGYTLRATPHDLLLQAVYPPTANRGGDATLAVTGLGFAPGIVITLRRGGESITADMVTWTGPDRVLATFDLGVAAVGTYDVEVQSNGATSQLADAFVVLNAPPDNGELGSLLLSVPGFTRPRFVYPVSVGYVNDTGRDLVAPLVYLTVDAGRIRVPGEHTWADSLLLLAIDPDLSGGILRAGEQGAIDVEYEGPSVAANVAFDAHIVDPEVAVDWAAYAAELRPDGVSEAAWAIVYANFLSEVGATWGDFSAVMAENATYLAAIGRPTRSVNALMAYEIQQANGFGAIASRFAIGAFGRGWPELPGISAEIVDDDHVIVYEQRAQRHFYRTSPEELRGVAGDFGVVTIENGQVRLLESNRDLYRFDNNGRFESVTDRNGNETTAQYGGERLISLTDVPSGDQTVYQYNADGLVDQVTDPVGRVTTLTYDNSRRLTGVTDVNGTTSFSYVTSGPARHAISGVTFPDDTHLAYTYDARGRLEQVATDAPGNTIAYSYDQFGNVTTTDAAGRTLTSALDLHGLTVQETNSAGQYRQMQYTADNLIAQIILPDGVQFGFDYDANGNLTETVDPLGNRNTFTHDLETNALRGFADPNGNETVNELDTKGNIVSTTYADGSVELFSYDGRGRLTAWTTRTGATIGYVYDNADLLVEKTLPDGKRVTYSYDARRNMTAATLIDGADQQTTTMTYDNAERLTSITYPTGRSLSFTYDAGGRRTQMATDDGFVVNYSYDVAGRLDEVRDGSDALLARYFYNADGTLARIERGNGSETAYTYDEAGQLTLLDNHVNGSSTSRFAYAYDLLGHVTELTTLDGTTAFTYDAAGQITSVAPPVGDTITYSYDAAGNRVMFDAGGEQTAITHGALNQPLTVGSDTYSYNDNGQVVQIDRQGEITQFQYDPEGRITAVSTATDTWEYEYDALGTRTAMIHNGVREEQLIDPAGFGNLVGAYRPGATTHFAYGDALISQHSASGAAFYEYDLAGHTAALTDGSGSVINSYRYLPFGEIVAETETVANPFKFNGQYGVRSQGGGLYDMRHRWYDTASGGFLQSDPIGLAGGETNLYLFVKNAPLQRSDPAGLTSIGQSFRAWWNSWFNTAQQVTETQVKDALAERAVDAGREKLAQEAVDAAFTPDEDWLKQEELKEYARKNKPKPKPKPQPHTTSPRVRPKGAPGATQMGVRGTSGFIRGGSFLLRGAASLGISLVGELIAVEIINRTVPTIEAQRHYQDSLGPLGNPAYGDRSRELIRDCLAQGFTVEECFGPRKDRKFSQNIASADPNDIVGPAGAGAERWVPVETPFNYTIRFENMMTATAPAQVVIITHTVDENHDPATFAFGAFGFSGTTYAVPDGRQVLDERLDLRDTLGFFVDVSAEFNPVTRQVVWRFISIDPETGDLIGDALAGFLPPNVEAPEGEGFVGYSIRPQADTPDGTTIIAQASIVFDTNEAIETNIWSNRIGEFYQLFMPLVRN